MRSRTAPKRPPVAGTGETRPREWLCVEGIEFECTIGVADIDATEKAVVAAGGKVIMSKCEIPTVGWLIKIQDPDGNVVCVKQPADAKS